MPKPLERVIAHLHGRLHSDHAVEVATEEVEEAIEAIVAAVPEVVSHVLGTLVKKVRQRE
jgi:hypothetical protein